MFERTDLNRRWPGRFAQGEKGSRGGIERRLGGIEDDQTCGTDVVFTNGKEFIGDAVGFNGPYGDAALVGDEKHERIDTDGRVPFVSVVKETNPFDGL